MSDVISILEQDHREVEQMFGQLEALAGDSSEDANARRKELVEQVTIELVRHSVAEEVLVYPAVTEKISEDEARHAREEHAEAEETLAALEKLDPDDAEFNSELSKLMDEIRHVPNTATARIAAGPVASLVDRMRDLATGRGSD